MEPSGTSSVSLDEDRARLGQRLDDVDVVHDLVADVDRGAVLLERALDGLDRSVDARAVAARLGEQDPFAGRPLRRPSWWRPECPC